MKSRSVLGVILAALWISQAHGHELWFRFDSSASPPRVCIQFGDTPSEKDAERVEEISRTQIWSDGNPLESTRSSEVLECRLGEDRQAPLSAYCDRGVVEIKSSPVLIHCTAFGQFRPLSPGAKPSTKVGEDEIVLALVVNQNGDAIVRARWKGKPLADAELEVYRQHGEPTRIRTNEDGESACPDASREPVFLHAGAIDRTPGKLDGRDYSEIRYDATLSIASGATLSPRIKECLARVADVHGAAGPWAVVGYRIGERALKELGLERFSFDISVEHHCPQQVQYSCVADGVQAATGASPGKLNLKVFEESTPEALRTIVVNRKTKEKLTFTIKPEFAKTIRDLPYDHLKAEGERVAQLPDDDIFRIDRQAPAPQK